MSAAPERRGVTRRDLMAGAVAGGASALIFGTGGYATGSARADDAPADERKEGPMSQRPKYHFSVPDNWKNDPQRPIFVDGEYLYYYLYNEDYIDGDGGGTSWRLATTTDHVRFRDRGVAIPKHTNANGDCWSGSVVVDEEGTAGFGEGALVALVTQAPNGTQAQFLWYSTDGGRTFSPGGEEPVLANPGVEDFRDPKIIRDEERGRWAMVNAEGTEIGFYVSDDLRSWRRTGAFSRDDIGVLECPDLFRMTADDGSSHWVFGISANGKAQGLPATYAYWVGTYDGDMFHPDHADPVWLDEGFDFYGAVTYAHHDSSGNVDASVRHAIGWSNFWDYPHNAPTMATDGYNGDDTIVRDIRLVRYGDGYRLASEPTAALASYAVREHAVGDVSVEGDPVDLDVRANAYELSTELVWSVADAPENVGIEVCRAPSGVRKVSLGAYLKDGYAYVNRTPTFHPAAGETKTPIDATTGSLKLRVLVDRMSVELFVDDGRHVQSHRVFPLAGDDGIQLFVTGGQATYRDLTIRELEVS